MSVILSATAPIFLIVAIGFLAARLGVLTADQFSGMGVLVMRLALPALILHTFSQRPMREVVDGAYLLVYGGGCLLLEVGAFALYRWIGRLGASESAIRALGMTSGNSGYVGFPIALGVVGPAAGIGLALCMLVENILIIPLALAAAEAGAGNGGSLRSVVLSTFHRLVRMPLLIAIAIGFAVSAAEIRFPDAVSRTLNILGNASAPLALLALGGGLAGLRPGPVLRPAAQIVVGKLVALPVLTSGILQLVPVADPDLRRALLIYTTTPMLSIFPIIGQRFGLGELASAALLGATIASFGTISVALWLIG